MADRIFEALGESTRRQILEVLASGECSAGAVVESMQAHTHISQPAVSQHLKVLREARLVNVRSDGTRRLYAINEDGLEAAHVWLDRLADPAGPFAQPLDALATEIARGKRESRRAGAAERERRADQGRRSA